MVNQAAGPSTNARRASAPISRSLENEHPHNDEVSDLHLF